MEGVGARLGRSSSRYGTTTVFTGPVRKWKKDWVPIPPPSSSSSSNNNSNTQNHHLQSSSSNGTNGTNNGNISHLRLYKWTPLSQRENGNSNKENNNSNSNGDNNQSSNGANVEDGSPNDENSKENTDLEQPPKKKFKYIPIAVLEEKKELETEENPDDDAKPPDGDDGDTAEPASNSDAYTEKPDINDVPMEENLDTEENQTAPGRHDLNESLDLSLGLNSHEGDHDSDSKTNLTKDE